MDFIHKLPHIQQADRCLLHTHALTKNPRMCCQRCGRHEQPRSAHPKCSWRRAQSSAVALDSSMAVRTQLQACDVSKHRRLRVTRPCEARGSRSVLGERRSKREGRRKTMDDCRPSSGTEPPGAATCLGPESWTRSGPYPVMTDLPAWVPDTEPARHHLVRPGP